MASVWTPRHPIDDFLADEPSLDDLFAEPIVQLIMARDHVSVKDMRLQMDRLLGDSA